MIKSFIVYALLAYSFSSFLIFWRFSFSQFIITNCFSIFLYIIPPRNRRDIFRNVICILLVTLIGDFIYLVKFLFVRRIFFLSIGSSDILWKVLALFFYLQFFFLLVIAVLLLFIFIIACVIVGNQFFILTTLNYQIFIAFVIFGNQFFIF